MDSVGRKPVLRCGRPRLPRRTAGYGRSDGLAQLNVSPSRRPPSFPVMPKVTLYPASTDCLETLTLDIKASLVLT